MSKKSSKSKKLKLKASNSQNKVLRKRQIWHSYFDAAMLIGIAVALVFSYVELLSNAGIIMLASIAASVFVLTHKYKHHLTMLGTVTAAYLVAAALSIITAVILRAANVPFFNQVIIVLVVLTAALYLLDVVHPPALTFGLAYLVFNNTIGSYIFVLTAVIMLFLSLRLVVYIYHDHLDIGNFVKEFIREEEELLAKEEKILKKRIKKI